MSQHERVDISPAADAGPPASPPLDSVEEARSAPVASAGPGQRLQRLFVVGLSHRTAPVDVREQLALPEEGVRLQLQQAARLAGGDAMLLSTCNRVELYATLPASATDLQGEAHRALLAPFEDVLLSGHSGARRYLYHHVGEAALRHLFRVASSLDSLVVGEPQILGQVKAAYRLAQTVGTIGSSGSSGAGGLGASAGAGRASDSPLAAAIPRAFSVAKRIRTETNIGRAAASVASVGVELATQVFGHLRGHPVLLIGAGKMAELCARHLREAGADTLLIANRTRRRAEDLAGRLGGSAHELSELESLLTRAAVVVCSAGAAQPLVTHEQVARVMRARRGRWLLFIDIAVPRDVEPSVSNLDNVYLYDIDALSDVAAGNRAEREKAAAQAEAIVEAELQRSKERLASADVTPVIKALRKKAQGIAQAEVARILPRLNSLSPRDRALVGGLADAVVNKLLHEPLTALKRSAALSAGGDKPRTGAGPRTSDPALSLASGRDGTSDGTSEGNDDRGDVPRSRDLAQAIVALWSLQLEESDDDPAASRSDSPPKDTEESPS